MGKPHQAWHNMIVDQIVVPTWIKATPKFHPPPIRVVPEGEAHKGHRSIHVRRRQGTTWHPTRLDFVRFAGQDPYRWNMPGGRGAIRFQCKEQRVPRTQTHTDRTARPRNSVVLEDWVPSWAIAVNDADCITQSWADSRPDSSEGLLTVPPRQNLRGRIARNNRRNAS